MLDRPLAGLVVSPRRDAQPERGSETPA